MPRVKALAFLFLKSEWPLQNKTLCQVCTCLQRLPLSLRMKSDVLLMACTRLTHSGPWTPVWPHLRSLASPSAAATLTLCSSPLFTLILSFQPRVKHFLLQRFFSYSPEPKQLTLPCSISLHKTCTICHLMLLFIASFISSSSHQDAYSMWDDYYFAYCWIPSPWHM